MMGWGGGGTTKRQGGGGGTKKRMRVAKRYVSSHIYQENNKTGSGFPPHSAKMPLTSGCFSWLVVTLIRGVGCDSFRWVSTASP